MIPGILAAGALVAATTSAPPAPPVGYGPHIGWRAFIDANNGDASFTSIREAQFLDASAAAITGGTNFQGGSGSDAGNGVNAPWDGNTANTWARSAVANVYFGKVYATPQSVVSLKVWCAAVAQAPRFLRLQYSDDTTTGLNGTWTDAVAIWDQSWTADGDTRTHPQDYTGGKYKGFRLRITSGNGNRFIRLYEMEMRATVSGADQCTGGASYASTSNTANIASALFDNSTATTFDIDTSPTPLPQSAGYCFSNPVSVGEFTLTCTDGDSQRTPKDMVFEGTTDGAIYTPLLTLSNQSWSPPQTKTYAVP